jgi:hypothetical protein
MARVYVSSTRRDLEHERLAHRDASNVQWRLDLVVSYSKLATLPETSGQERRRAELDEPGPATVGA